MTEVYDGYMKNNKGIDRGAESEVSSRHLGKACGEIRSRRNSVVNANFVMHCSWVEISRVFVELMLAIFPFHFRP